MKLLNQGGASGRKVNIFVSLFWLCLLQLVLLGSVVTGHNRPHKTFRFSGWLNSSKLRWEISSSSSVLTHSRRILHHQNQAHYFSRLRGGADNDNNNNSEQSPPATSAPQELQSIPPPQPTTPSAVESPVTTSSTSPTATATSVTTTTADTTMNALTKIRQAIFPIHGKDEVKKFLLLGSIKFFIIMALTLTRDTKDTLVVTQCGAEAIAFLKVRI